MSGNTEATFIVQQTSHVDTEQSTGNPSGKTCLFDQSIPACPANKWAYNCYGCPNGSFLNNPNEPFGLQANCSGVDHSVCPAIGSNMISGHPQLDNRSASVCICINDGCTAFSQFASAPIRCTYDATIFTEVDDILDFADKFCSGSTTDGCLTDTDIYPAYSNIMFKILMLLVLKS